MMPALSVAPGRPLAELLAGLAAVAPAEDRVIGHLALDSGDVDRGTLFAALSGTRRHGLEFVDDVLRRGAVAIVWEPDPRLDPAAAERACAAAGVPLLMVPDLRMQLSFLAGRFFGEPSRELSLIGVTGTDGKTSVSQFIAQALSIDRPCGVIGTLGYGLLGSLVPPTHTTPDAITVQRLLKDMRDLGARYAAMEVSSHALAQGRVAALHYRVAVLTNLTRDHLDYHGSEEAYAAAKAKLFAMPGLEYAVLNHDDPFGRRVKAALPRSVMAFDYSLDPRQRQAALSCRKLRHSPDGLVLQVDTPVGAAEFSVPLLGRFNAANAVAALATLFALGLPLADAVARLEGLQPVAGRMERFGGGGLPTVIVDYAHTPAALAAALDAVRQHTSGRVWCVFGCGGDRDRGKRSQMGVVADRQADEIVITDDNPRSEDPHSIIGDVLAGIEGHEPFVVRDRAAAIRLAVEQARPGDAVLIAGKGHEDYQIVGSERLPFDDRAVVRAALQERAPWSN